MNRRQFTKTLASSAIAIALPAVSVQGKPQVAITMDDFNLFGATPDVAEQRNRAILQALRQHGNLQAAGFVTGGNVNSELGRSLVKAWSDAGHLIANHTYSHWYYHKRTVEEFSADALRVETQIKDLPGFTKLFRFPMLKEGDTVERRDGMRAWLKQHGYKMGYVTIDASDWYIDQRLRARRTENPQADVTGFRKFYLDHLWQRATYYDDLSRKALGRSVKHTLLIHHNVLNELFLDDVLTMFERRGWQLIGAKAAFADPVFDKLPNILPAGESLVWALAKESGKFDQRLRYPAEDSEYEKAAMDKLGL
ncbi:MAG: polysaccharide deacetylase family protein [Acidobacteria bacterium]|nr:polysaccharide deacetylase family protein [Acidobacteriota bacterium]